VTDSCGKNVLGVDLVRGIQGPDTI